MPLSDLRVLELATILAGPLVGQFCAELGAEVIKVEPRRGGDPTRGWRLPQEPAEAAVSAYFSCANWGKRSIALDLRDDDDRGVVHQLLERVDVVILSFRPGVDRQLGLDASTLRDCFPRLIVLQVQAYGSEDPRPGFDAIIQAESGFTFLNGPPDGPPTKMPVALMDVLAAHQLKQGLLLALRRRERCGEGSVVATSLLGSGVASLANQAANWLHAGVAPQRLGSEHPNIVPYGSRFVTRDDRELVLAVGTDRQFRELATALEQTDWLSDPRFADNAARVRHRQVVQEAVAAQVARLDGAELATALTQARVPFGFVHDMPAVFDQPVAARQCFDDPRGVRSVALEGTIHGRRDLEPPPELDQHGAELRAWLNAASRNSGDARAETRRDPSS